MTHVVSTFLDVLADSVVVGRIMKVNAAPEEMPWLWTLAFGHHEDRHADARLRGDTRGRDGGVRQKLAAGVGRSLITAQIAAPRLRLSKK
jgi:hypothetical protein